ncbi:MAG: protoporphyrinogen oxidase [bacterium]
MTSVVVIGGGVSGLAAALKLVARGCAVKVLEAAGEPGGATRTTRREGFLLEAGPDSFITIKPWGLDLIRRLGLGGEIVGTNPSLRRSFVIKRSRLLPIPEGFYLLGPTRILPFVISPLLSWPGKWRALADLWLPRGPAVEDESLASFVTRRFGREMLDRIAQPMVAGIYTADPRTLSLRATFPAFLEMEKKYGSVIRGLRARRGRGEEAAASGPRYGLFATLRGGLGGLVDALVKGLPASTLACGVRAERLERSGAGWRVTARGGATFDAEGVVLALPAPGAGELLRPLDRGLGDLLDGVPYATAITVNLGYRREQIRHPLDGFGFVTPDVERREVLACTFSSVKFPERAPEGRVLLRAFMGGAARPDHARWEAAELAKAAVEDLAVLLGITGEPLFADVVRHVNSMPQYLVGHVERAARIRARVRGLPGLALAGTACDGIGLPDTIHAGESAAHELLGALVAKTN